MKELAYIGWQNYLAQPKSEKDKIMRYKDWLDMVGLGKKQMVASPDDIRKNALEMMAGLMRA